MHGNTQKTRHLLATREPISKTKIDSVRRYHKIKSTLWTGVCNHERIGKTHNGHLSIKRAKKNIESKNNLGGQSARQKKTFRHDASTYP